MITLNRADYQYTLRTADWVGLSTDEFNNLQNFIELNNGDRYICIDTGAEYLFDGENNEWALQPESGGGGSGDTGVTSFNGRTGTVTPQATDYPPNLIGAVDKAGDTMTGDLNMDGNKVSGVSSIIANGSTGNSGVQFTSNGNFTNIVCGVSTSASFSANAVDFYNHNLDRVNSINMTSEATVEDAKYIGGNVEKTNRTAVDFTTENAVGIWAQGTKQVNIDANGVDVNGNKITGVDSIVAEGSTIDNIKFESDGAIVGIVCEGTRSVTFTANTIDAYEHQITRVGAPINNTDAARKQDVDTVQTAVDTVSETVDGIIDGTEVIPYLPDNGGTLTGPLNMGNNKITNLAAPSDSNDAVRQTDLKVVSDELDAVIAGTMPITLPIASDTHVGGIKVGTGLSIEEDGTLNTVQSQSATPVASATELGCVKVGTGLFIENDGTLEATAGLYRDAASGIVFVGPNTSKTMRLSESFQVLYGTEYGISADALDPNWGGPFYMNAGQSKTIGNLQVSFNQNGAEFTITNSHASVCYFFMYGGYSLPTT